MTNSTNIERPNWDEIFLEICDTISKRSTCQRLQTASVIVKNLNIISIGYNGVPSGSQHCSDYWKNYDYQKLCFNSYDIFLMSEVFQTLHHDWSINNELHAEINAILQSETSVKESILYTLYSPCLQCSKSIVSAKIGKVVYKNKYVRDLRGLEFLQKHNVECVEYLACLNVGNS